MSACISRHGEFGSHEADELGVCRLCGVEADDRIERYSQLLAKAERERDEACAELIVERERWQELAGLRFGDGVVGMLAEHMEWRRILTDLHTGLHRCFVDGVTADYIVCTTNQALGLYRERDGFCPHGRTDSAWCDDCLSEQDDIGEGSTVNGESVDESGTWTTVHTYPCCAHCDDSGNPERCGSDEATQHPQPCQKCKSEQSRARLVDSCRYCGWLGGEHANGCLSLAPTQRGRARCASTEDNGVCVCEDA